MFLSANNTHLVFEYESRDQIDGLTETIYNLTHRQRSRAQRVRKTCHIFEIPTQQWFSENLSKPPGLELVIPRRRERR